MDTQNLHGEQNCFLAVCLSVTRMTEASLCLQYHEVITFLCGRFLGAVTIFFVMLNVFGISVAQVIACSSDAYYWRTSLSKRYYPLTEPLNLARLSWTCYHLCSVPQLLLGAGAPVVMP